MARKPSGKDTLNFTMQVLRLIPRDRPISAREIHQKLAELGVGRDIRSVQRTLEELVEGFPIDCNRDSKPYSYRWRKGQPVFSFSSLTATESLLLLMARQQLSTLLPPSVMRKMDAFFKEADHLVAHDLDHQLQRDWLRKVRVVNASQPLLPPRIDPKVFEVVSEALYRNQELSIEYRNSVGKVTNSRIQPLGLAQQGVRTYLVCRFAGHDDNRILALHRIVSVQETHVAFTLPKDFDLAAYDQEGQFGVNRGRPVRMTLVVRKHGAQYLLETPLATDQTVEEIGDTYRIRATVVPTELLTRWLRGFGPDLVKVTPAGLIES